MLQHNYIGTEHLLLGLVHEGHSVAADALQSLGISLEAVRKQVTEIVGRGQRAPSGHIPFTPRAKRVLELSLREALLLSHHYIGTEHILLGLIREGEGIAAQALVRLGADLNLVREQVVHLVQGGQGGEPGSPEAVPGEPRRRAPAVVSALESRMSAVEQRVGTGPATVDIDEQIAEVQRDKEAAIDSHDFERAASLRDREKQLLATKAAVKEQWEAGHPDLVSLAEQVQELGAEVKRLRALLRRHGIEAEDRPA